MSAAPKAVPATPRSFSSSAYRVFLAKISSRLVQVSTSSSMVQEAFLADHLSQGLELGKRDDDETIAGGECAVGCADVDMGVRARPSASGFLADLKTESSCIWIVVIASSILTCTSCPSPVRSR